MSDVIESGQGWVKMKGPTPSGGDYSLWMFKGPNGEAVDEEQAVACEIHEMTESGECLNRVYGRMNGHPA